VKSGVHVAQKRKYALKRVKIDEKLLWSGVPIQEFANALSNGTIPTPYGLPFPKIGGSQPQPKTVIAIISGSYELPILCAHSRDRSEQKPIKNFGKSSRGRNRGLSKIFRAPI